MKNVTRASERPKKAELTKAAIARRLRELGVLKAPEDVTERRIVKQWSKKGLLMMLEAAEAVHRKQVKATLRVVKGGKDAPR
jgi:hypothetical protein